MSPAEHETNPAGNVVDFLEWKRAHQPPAPKPSLTLEERLALSLKE